MTPRNSDRPHPPRPRHAAHAPGSPGGRRRQAGPIPHDPSGPRPTPPPVSYPRELPITARKDEIVRAIRSRRVVIISGETGCGKSTQIPKMCLEAGRGRDGGIIGCTQPRRLAAVTIAYRIAEEMGEELGRSVGYKIRFQDRSARDGFIKIMTDGILLAETQGDRLLRAYDTIIIDEAHERSLNIDFLLGIMRRLLDARPDLHLIITSATLDTEKFSAAFRNAPVIEVSGRLYPVEVEYRPPTREEAEDKDYVDQAVDAVSYLRREKPPGDILVFMPTEQDILETCRILEGRKLPLTTILPLYSRLPAGRQRMVYTVHGPKIVVATNVAETSLTIPGIRYVVDTGVARISQYQPGTRINSLPITPVSRASADQRKGRCGRVREGLCVRLYSETDYESRDRFTAPEILRSDLAEVILRMIDLRLGDPLDFPFIDRPSSKAVSDGYDTLVELAAIRKRKLGTQYLFPGSKTAPGRVEGGPETTAGEHGLENSIVSPISGRAPGAMKPRRVGHGWALTEMGRSMARMPLDPRVSRMLLEARRENCVPEVAILAAALSIRDPRERPPEQSAQADAAHEGFRHPDSDFLVLLNIWNRYHGDPANLGSAARRRRFCHEHFLSFPRMREWTYLHQEIGAVLREQRLGGHAATVATAAQPPGRPHAGSHASAAHSRSAAGPSMGHDVGSGGTRPGLGRGKLGTQYLFPGSKTAPGRATGEPETTTGEHGLENSIVSPISAKTAPGRATGEPETTAGEQGLENSIVSPISGPGRPHADVSPALYGGIHRSILAGFLSNIAVHKERNTYAAAKNREVMLWPGSVLFNKSAAWVVATEMVKTSRLFARTAARIQPAWLEALGGALCKRAYSDAAWSRDRGEVTAKERITLFGLEIVRDRRVSYGPVNPAEAHAIFVMSALVEGDVEDPPHFLGYNLALQRRVETMEEKMRRRDIMVSEARIARFYSERLPGVHDIRTLAKLIRDRGGDDFLRLTESDLVGHAPDPGEIAAFPDTVEVAGRPFRALYRFAPGEDEDGVTIEVPAPLLSVIPGERLEWVVPGQYEAKIEALIKGLPKRWRKLLVPVGEKAATIAREMPRAPEEVPLHRAVAEFVRRRFGVDIPPREWAAAEVPRHLRMRVAVTDPGSGRVIEAGRDVELLKRVIGAADTAPSKIESPAWRQAQARWERTGVAAWDFGDLPEKVAVGTSLTAYPALVVEPEAAPAPKKTGDTIPISGLPARREPASPTGKTGPKEKSEGSEEARSGKAEGRRLPEASAGGPTDTSRVSLSVRLFPTRAAAEAAHRAGVRTLLMRKFAKDLAFVGRYHKVPQELERASLHFGGRRAVEEAVERALARETFERDIRTEADFKAYEAEVGRTLFEKGHALIQTALRTIGLYAALRTDLARDGRALASGPQRQGMAGRGAGPGPGSGAGAAGSQTGEGRGAAARPSARPVPRRSRDLNELIRPREPVVPAYLEAISRELDRLVPRDFLEACTVAELARLPRYLEAMRVRLERARIDPEKDRAKEAQVEPYAAALERLEESDEPEARPAVRELRWMIEEFKIAVFAPEIKTAYPVSGVRLARKIKDIESQIGDGPS